MARAQGAHAERVEKPAELPEALSRARNAVINKKRQAMLNVITPY
jgi:thiamine pyrophosphate-dependent acetolactate synthase large subunit-like protein